MRHAFYKDVEKIKSPVKYWVYLSIQVRKAVCKVQ